MIKKYCKKYWASDWPLITLILILAYGLWELIIGWKLDASQSIGAIATAAAIPFSIMTAQATFKRQYKMELSRTAYNAMLEKTNTLEKSISSSVVSLLGEVVDNSSVYIQNSIDMKKAISDFTNTYHAHEMIFVEIERYFKFIHFTAQRLSDRLLDVKPDVSYYFPGGDQAPEKKIDKLQLKKNKKLREDLQDLEAWIYDLHKEIIMSLGFDSVTGTVIERRKPLDKEYKTLDQAATKKAVRNLEASQ